MKAYQRYFNQIQTQLQLVQDQHIKIETAANWIAGAVMQEGFIYTSGTGHSHLLAEEIFYRAGGFARVVPILDDALMLHKDAAKSTEFERQAGYGKELMEGYFLTTNDIFIISSNSGRNTVSIEMALIAKTKGAKVIVITNLRHTHAVDSRHPSGKKLFEIADLFFDNGGEIGDASIQIDGMGCKVGATSTAVGSVILQSILVQACEEMIKKGFQPEVFNSSNTNEGETHNQALIRKYKGVIKSL